eukprot:8618868-Alexandrium_andersonii.AAC.1
MARMQRHPGNGGKRWEGIGNGGKAWETVGNNWKLWETAGNGGNRYETLGSIGKAVGDGGTRKARGRRPSARTAVQQRHDLLVPVGAQGE